MKKKEEIKRDKKREREKRNKKREIEGREEKRKEIPLIDICLTKCAPALNPLLVLLQ
jgi:hypothetical protein